jgi:hypothetical protein
MAWFISNLSEPYISSTTFDLNYANAGSNLMLVNSSHDKVKVNLEAVGFQFLRFSFSKKKAVIDLSGVQNKNSKYYITPQRLKTQIEKQLPNSMRLIDVQSDTLYFDFQDVISKKVTIRPKLQLNLAQNYLLDGKLKVTPTTVTIKGPKNEVGPIKSIETMNLEFNNLASDFSRNTELKIPTGLKNTTFSNTSVTITGKVSRFSEKMITVGIKVMNLPSGTTIKMFPEKVNVLCKGTLNSLKNLSVSEFEVVADFSELATKGSKKLSLSLHKKPKELSSAVLQESEVEYILKRQ